MGRPQIILPRTADQPFHAALVERHGWGLGVRRRGLDARALRATIGRVAKLEVPTLGDDGCAEVIAICAQLAGRWPVVGLPPRTGPILSLAGTE